MLPGWSVAALPLFRSTAKFWYPRSLTLDQFQVKWSLIFELTGLWGGGSRGRILFIAHSTLDLRMNEVRRDLLILTLQDLIGLDITHSHRLIILHILHRRTRMLGDFPKTSLFSEVQRILIRVLRLIYLEAKRLLQIMMISPCRGLLIILHISCRVIISWTQVDGGLSQGPLLRPPASLHSFGWEGLNVQRRFGTRLLMSHDWSVEGAGC